MLPTYNITATIEDSDGEPVAGATVIARLTKNDYDTALDISVAKETYIKTTDINGQCIFPLWPNVRGNQGSQYRFRAYGTSGKIFSYIATVTESDNDLTDIIDLPAPSSLTDAQIALAGAQSAQSAAEQARDDAETAEANASGSASAASTSESNSAASASDAAASAAKLQGTSTSSVAIGTGSKSFTTQSGKFFNAGNFLMIISSSSPSNYMTGNVTSYSGTSLTVNMLYIGGSGTFNDWGIFVAGRPGDTGSGGNADTLNGQSGSYYTNASNLNTGTIPDARFPATLPAISGANLTNLNANNLTSGTVPDARFPATLPVVSGANLTNLNASNLLTGVLPAQRTSLAAALVYRTSNQTIAHQTDTDIIWQGEAYDSDSIFSGSNPERLTIPTGATYARVIACVTFDQHATGYRQVLVQASTGGIRGRPLVITPSSGTSACINVCSAWMALSSGYFKIQVTQTSGVNLDIIAGTHNLWAMLEWK